jgi:glycine oxidase
MSHFSIAGGGIVGMSIAWRLAQRGIGVTVFDVGRIGGEASWAGAGMLAPGGEVGKKSHLAELTIKSLRLYPGFVAELEEESGVPIDFRICGAIERHADRDRVEAQCALGIIAESRPDGTIWYPGDAVVDPRDVLRALRIASERRGVALREHEPIRRVEGPTIIAAGAWSSAIETPVTIPNAFPIRGHLVSYRMPAGSQGPILRSGPTYVLQRASGLTIAGSSTERVGFDRTVDPSIVEDIDRRAKQLLPELGEPFETWVGFRPATDSLEPEIGRIPGTELWLAYGHYRNGILLAPVTANLILEEI